MLWPLGSEKPRKAVDCAQARVAGSDAVMPIGIEELQKLHDTFGTQVSNLQLFDPSARIASCELQQQARQIQKKFSRAIPARAHPTSAQSGR